MTGGSGGTFRDPNQSFERISPPFKGSLSARAPGCEERPRTDIPAPTITTTRLPPRLSSPASSAATGHGNEVIWAETMTGSLYLLHGLWWLSAWLWEWVARVGTRVWGRVPRSVGAATAGCAGVPATTTRAGWRDSIELSQPNRASPRIGFE